jgi:hypothetical protein
MFVVLEGFDIGTGILQYVVGKTEAERRLVIAAIGPLWSWHEVWLVGFGGVLLVSFPTSRRGDGPGHIESDVVTDPGAGCWGSQGKSCRSRGCARPLVKNP